MRNALAVAVVIMSFGGCGAAVVAEGPPDLLAGDDAAARDAARALDAGRAVDAGSVDGKDAGVLDASVDLTSVDLAAPDLMAGDMSLPADGTTLDLTARDLSSVAAMPDLAGSDRSIVDLESNDRAVLDSASDDAAIVDSAMSDFANADLGAIDFAMGGDAPGSVMPADLASPDLSQPDLSQPDLSQPDLSQPDLSQPDLSQPDLSQPDLSPSCTDGVRNGAETDVDCGGGACPRCGPGRLCSVAGDCSAGSCQTTCQCPTGMVLSSAPVGFYCIDAVEVTYGLYQAFYAANPPTAGQEPACAFNTGWTPTGNWPPQLSGVNVPITYVNECQAKAYCRFSGRHLCGKIGGGAIAPSSFNDDSLDEWYRACTGGGSNIYPYGGSYSASACNGGGTGPLAQASLLGCQGGEPGLYEMSGNVAEWEDACSDTSGAGDACAVRGGSYLDDAQGLRCDSNQSTLPPTRARDYAGPEVGFRCCL